MLSRREYLSLTAASCAALTLRPALVCAQPRGSVIKHRIPSTSEELPIVGLGTSASFQRLANAGNTDAIAGVIQTLFDNGGTVIDTAPGYGSSEELAARVVDQLGLKDRAFWATKLNVAGFGGGSANPDRARAQLDASLGYWGGDAIDLIQVHNLGDIPTQLPILAEAKQDGRVRYIGTTTTFAGQYDQLVQVMQKESLDFIGIDYAVDNRNAEDRIFPIAEDRGIAVMVYMPFGRSRLWSRVEGRVVPEWASEFGADSWAQFFIKFAASHPAVTVVTPATSNPEHMLDDAGAAFGRLPDAGERQRMAEFIDSLPES